jgi:hypothetical protein
MRCSNCGSNQFRYSRIRLSDFLELLLLRFPIRCRICNRRNFTGLRNAMNIQQADTTRHKAQHDKDREARHPSPPSPPPESSGS